MSASPWARQATESKAIPIRRVTINDSSELPGSYSSTPGGTLYSTTPGGTRIIYEKSTLMNLRNSPISRTPPSYNIPDSVLKGKVYNSTTTNHNNSYDKNHCSRQTPQKRNNRNDDDVQFPIDL